MFKDRRTYTDYNGVERTEDFYFNLTESEIIELEMGTTGGLADMIEHIVSAQDISGIIKIFKEILLKAYGEKSPDGRRFIKTEELSRAYSQTEAYNQLFMELATDPEKAATFINGIVPNVASSAVADKVATSNLSIVK